MLGWDQPNQESKILVEFLTDGDPTCILKGFQDTVGNCGNYHSSTSGLDPVLHAEPGIWGGIIASGTWSLTAKRWTD